MSDSDFPLRHYPPANALDTSDRPSVLFQRHTLFDFWEGTTK